MSSIGRNSMIMAAGTFASRITGQIRQILLAAAVGTTGIAAMAYQTGSQIPQVVFNLISGGIFNAVLVPQIVRALKQEDAKERLDKLITAAITLLIAVTGVMMLLTPWITQLYINSSWDDEQRALANAFTLWCMPQIFFYGLYTVLGQILAAKERFGMYAWSSVGANVISCAGFALFIWEFGNAARQPVSWWTADRIALTAGTWTAGVAFQAVILFLPLTRIGLHYRPRFGLRGIGLRSMGRVAMWSMALVVLNLLMGMVSSQVLTGAPARAGDMHGVAGNASYQYAYTLQMLPYSLFAVSIATAMFPKLSRAISDRDIAAARRDLSSSLRSTSLVMMFFTVVLLLLPAPVTIALVPTISYDEAQLIAGPMVPMALNLVLTSVVLLLQRSFYAFEDGRSPFLFAVVQNVVQLVLLLAAVFAFPAQWWATLVAWAITLSNAITMPLMVRMARRRFDGHLDGRRVMLLLVKAGIAALAAFGAGFLTRMPLDRLMPLDAQGMGGARRWVLAVITCAVVTVVATAVFGGVLWALRCEELTSVTRQLSRRLPIPGRRAGRDGGSGDGDAQGDGTRGSAPRAPRSARSGSHSETPSTATPADTMTPAQQRAESNAAGDRKDQS
ncbi:virulence factor protein [Bifidobacterium sp. DSM 109958]|uniref:Virulence factor protein n=1 Tax=Bifidobacterium moraviense TaxID=2675323 RepID=A0A7Y0F2U8_9BIFI|nr:lipid II flippase MurJ [Bifidobacterium sp. DSM 109958]NMN01021.1 virulence factor protein [Bifidobacterium sp. DSM 109958]